MNYMIHQRERVENNEISANTLSNYYKPIRAFCEMNDLELNWKKITRGLPKGKGYASDRIPTSDCTLQSSSDIASGFVVFTLFMKSHNGKFYRFSFFMNWCNLQRSIF